MVRVIRPSDLDEALDLLSQNTMIVFAGGTDLMIRYRAWAGTLPDWPSDILHIQNLEVLKTIVIESDLISIGSCVTISEILNHPQIPEFIKSPLRQIGSTAIRNAATIGGNLCNASPSGDALTMLTALDARVITRSKADGEKNRLVSEFITGPKKTCLKSDELVIRICIPIDSYHSFYYRKVGARSANAITKLSLYGLIKDPAFSDIRIAFGAMGPKIIRDRSVELALIHADPKDRLALSLEKYGDLLNPIDDVRSTKAYRKQVAMNLLSDFMESEGNHEKTER